MCLIINFKASSQVDQNIHASDDHSGDDLARAIPDSPSRHTTPVKRNTPVKPATPDQHIDPEPDQTPQQAMKAQSNAKWKVRAAAVLAISIILYVYFNQ